ncbi:MAG: DnaJ domain-containing protein [Caldilineaceae bacterium]|nr:DnaJ domain-containing protein [Caldilineaceae bacterium]
MKDYYAILDVPPGATADQIRSRYKLLVRIYHPDRFQAAADKTYAQEKLKEINEAYRALLNVHVEEGFAQASVAPRPNATPSLLRFADLEPGARQVDTVHVTNLGGPPSHVSFSLGGEHHWFSVSNGRRLDPDELLPLDFDIAADGGYMEPGRAYEGWVDVLVDGIATRVLVTGQLPDSRTDLRLTPRLMALLTTALVVVVVLYLGSLLSAQQSGGAWASLKLPGADNTISASAAPPSETTSQSGESVTSRTDDSPTLPVLIAPNPTVAPAIEMPATSTQGAVSPQPSQSSQPVGEPTLTRQTPASGGAPSLSSLLAAARPIATSQADATADIQPNSMQERVSSVALVVAKSSDEKGQPEAEIDITPDRRGAPTPQANASPLGAATHLATATVALPATPLPLPTVVDTDADVIAVTTSGPPPATSPESAVDTLEILVPETHNVMARATNSLRASIVTILGNGSLVTAIGRTVDNTWLQVVVLDGQTAWVHVEAIGVVPESAARLPVVASPAIPISAGETNQAASETEQP